MFKKMKNLKVIVLFTLLALCLFTPINSLEQEDDNFGTGIGNTYIGNGNHWKGNFNDFIGNKNTAIGNSNKIKGNMNNVAGNDNFVDGEGNFVIGKGNKIISGNSVNSQEAKAIQNKMTKQFESRMANMFPNFPSIPHTPIITTDDVLGPVIAEQSKMKNSGFQRLQELMNLHTKQSLPSIYPSYSSSSLPYGQIFPSYSQRFPSYGQRIPSYHPYVSSFPLQNVYHKNYGYNAGPAMNNFPFNNGFNQNQAFNPLSYAHQYNVGSPYFAGHNNVFGEYSSGNNLRSDDFSPFHDNRGFSNYRNLIGRK